SPGLHDVVMQSGFGTVDRDANHHPRVVDRRPRPRKLGLAEAPSVREHMYFRPREQVATERQKSDESITVESWLASGETDIRSTRWKEPYKLEGVFQEPIVFNRLRRLRAHQAVVIATLREEHAVVLTFMTPEDANLRTVFGERHDVAWAQVVELGWKLHPV